MVSLLLAHYLQRLSELELETHLLGGGGRCQVQSLCYKVKTIDNVYQKITANPVILTRLEREPWMEG